MPRMLRRGEEQAFMPSPDNKPLRELHERYKDAREMKRIALQNDNMVSYDRYGAKMQEIKVAMTKIMRDRLRVLGLITAEEVHRVKLRYSAPNAFNGYAEECWYWGLQDKPLVVDRRPEHKNGGRSATGVVV